MLGSFIKQDLNRNSTLEKPVFDTNSKENSRPELLLFDAQNKAIEAQSNVLRSKTYPRFSLFLQSGIGRPALNMLDNDFAFYYIGGLRLQWNLSSFYTQSKEQQVLTIQKEAVEVQRETFLFGTQLQTMQQDIEVSKWQTLLKSDQKLVELRQKIKLTSASQLENGTITSTEYLTHVNAEEQARKNLALHEIQWLLAQYQKKLTAGM
jgi:outer membrane protein TolC